MPVETDELLLPRVQPRVLRQEVLEAVRSEILIASGPGPGSSKPRSQAAWA